MTPILNYQQFVSELAAAASQRAGVPVARVRLAATESQLINLLKDLEGTIICGNFPPADVSHAAATWRSDGTCLLMVLEKMPRDEQGLASEADRYARLQRLMQAIVDLLTAQDEMQQICDRADLDTTQPLRIEWEYNTYGGFSGLSVTFHMLGA